MVGKATDGVRLFLVLSPLHFAWNLYPSCSNLKICTPPYIAGFSLDAKAPNKYSAPLYSLIHSVRTSLSASKPSINQSSSLYFPVGARKPFLSMVPSITDYVSSNDCIRHDGRRITDISWSPKMVRHLTPPIKQVGSFVITQSSILQNLPTQLRQQWWSRWASWYGNGIEIMTKNVCDAVMLMYHRSESMVGSSGEYL